MIGGEHKPKTFPPITMAHGASVRIKMQLTVAGQKIGNGGGGRGLAGKKRSLGAGGTKKGYGVNVIKNILHTHTKVF